jgi:alpha-acetolactate decarboxylase
MSVIIVLAYVNNQGTIFLEINSCTRAECPGLNRSRVIRKGGRIKMKKGIVVAVLGLIVVIVLMMGLRISQNEKAAITTLGPSQSAYQGQERDILYQVSTFNALLDGLYDGQFSFGELRKYGDTGIGTVAGLDGELVVLDGQFYQVKADGVAYPVDDNMQTPFASVSYFDADKTVTLSGSMDFAQLQDKLNEMITNKNIFHVIKINGDFKYVKTRSVPGQQKPYPPMVEVTKNQPEFEFENVTGTLVGFWCPPMCRDKCGRIPHALSHQR